MYYVYILHSKTLNKLYKGYCKDLKKRIKQHLSGNVKSTKNTKDWKLIYYQGFVNKKDAAREEKFLKTGKGKERLKFLLKYTLNGGFA